MHCVDCGYDSPLAEEVFADGCPQCGSWNVYIVPDDVVEPMYDEDAREER